ncbi:MAG: SET domain-containing protein [Nitrospirae bacterium]|nr:SET domain-containing protein [Nitrospirota bacterium]
MLLVNAWVGQSKIHGLGLIAHEFIPSGTIVWRLAPGFDAVLSEAQLKGLSLTAQNHVQHYGYFDTRHQKYVLCAAADRFTNHSENANTRFFGDHSIAIRDIQEGEEITNDYTELEKPINSRTTDRAAT